MKKFTLIELLVVISIIGILLTLLLPSLSQARVKAKKAVCMSNTNQIGKAFIVNSGNHNGRVFWDETGNNGNWPWSISEENVIEIDLPEVLYRCPVKDSYDFEGAWTYVNGFHATGYTYTFKRPTGGMSSATLSGGMEWVDRISGVDNPGDTPFVTDAVFKGTSNGFYDQNPFGYRTNHVGNYKMDQNTTFVDGHSKLRYISSIKQRYNAGLGYFWW